MSTHYEAIQFEDELTRKIQRLQALRVEMRVLWRLDCLCGRLIDGEIKLKAELP